MFRKSWLLAVMIMLIASLSWSTVFANEQELNDSEDQDDAIVEGVETELNAEDDEAINNENNEEPDLDEEGDKVETEESEGTEDDDEIEGKSDEDDQNRKLLKSDPDPELCNSPDPITLKSGEVKPVCPHQTVYFGNGSYVVMPIDLPEGTTFKVTDVSGDDFVTNAEGLTLTGDAFTFELTLPDTTVEARSALVPVDTPEYPYSLYLSYNTDYADSNIYYDNNGNWEAQKGVTTVADTINLEVSHFSTYAVFSEAVEPATCEDEITIDLDKESDVCASQKVHIGGDDIGAFLIMPDDLPDGTTLSATDISETDIVKDAQEKQNLFVCGATLSFDLTVPGDMTFDDSFTLHMAYCNGGDDMGVYYYDEEIGEWVKRQAEYQYHEDPTIMPTLYFTFDDFASFGVLDYWIEEDKQQDDVVVIDPIKKDDDDPTTVVTVEDGDDKVDDKAALTKNGKILPSTATNVFNFLLIGFALFIIGFTFVIIKRKMANKQS